MDGIRSVAYGVAAILMAGCSAFGLQSPTSSRSNNALTRDAKDLRKRRRCQPQFRVN